MLLVNVHIARNDFEMQSGQTDSLSVCPSMVLSGFTTSNWLVILQMSVFLDLNMIQNYSVVIIDVS